MNQIAEFASLIGKRYGSGKSNIHLHGGCINFSVAAIRALRKKGMRPKLITLGWDHAAVRVKDIDFDGGGLLTPSRVSRYGKDWDKKEEKTKKECPGHIPLPGEFMTIKEFRKHPGGGGDPISVDGVNMLLMWDDAYNPSESEMILKELDAIMSTKAHIGSS